jgi:hypothetical protein
MKLSTTIRIMLKKTVIIVFLIMLSACATKHVTISQQTGATLSGKVLQNSKYEKPDFSAMTAGKALFGMIGAASMISAGNDIVEKNLVEDPAIYISEKIGLALSDKYNLPSSQLKPETCVSDDINTVINTYKQADLILDIETIGWGFLYYPTHWKSYRINYGARLRLIDTQSKKVIAEESCRYLPEYSEDNPSYNDLVDNNAAGLKHELRKAGDYCIEFFKEKAFQMKHN